jgi:hypothetical protein
MALAQFSDSEETDSAPEKGGKSQSIDQPLVDLFGVEAGAGSGDVWLIICRANVVHILSLVVSLYFNINRQVLGRKAESKTHLVGLVRQAKKDRRLYIS